MIFRSIYQRSFYLFREHFPSVLGEVLFVLCYNLFIEANALPRTSTSYAGAANLQVAHIANIPLLARACIYNIPHLSKNMQEPVKSL